MNAKEIQRREKIECVKILQISIPAGRVYSIKEHARKYDGQQNSLNKFILRAIDIAMLHDQEIEKEIDAAMSEYWKKPSL